jgi:hypothetical protein
MNENTLESRVANAIKAMRELKQSQYIGSDSVRFYKSDTGNVYDWGGIPPVSTQAAYVSTKIIRVTATAISQNVLFADLIPEHRINSSTGPRHTILNYIDELYASSTYFNIAHFPDPQLPGQENKQSWTVSFSGTDFAGVTRPLNNQYMKAYVVANDDVTITIQELN